MSTNTRFSNLAKPGRIGTLDIRNRFVMAPMCTGFASHEGFVTERMIDYYAERARGGVGLIIVATGCIDYPRGRTDPDQLGLSDDKFIPGLRQLADAIHKHGAKVAIQFHHGGRYSASDVNGGAQPVAPSPIPLIPGADVPRELTVEEIAEIVKLYGLAATRARKAGFDAVEIHCAHGYLINEFLSRSTNKRQDSYNGDLAGRARFMLEVLSSVRNGFGADAPVWCRLNGSEFDVKDGLTPEECREIARMTEKAGMNAVHVTGQAGSFGVSFTKAPLVNTPNDLIPFAAGIKKVVSIPVITVGRVTLEAGEEAIRDGEADFVAMGRALIADPELPAKALSGKTDDIRHCLHCYTCVGQSYKRQAVVCAINAAVGFERECAVQKSSKPKKVVIVGGGPAGMEAARVAALKGHRVTLHDKEHRLGGSLFFAAIARSDNEYLTQYLKKQIKDLGVEVKLGSEVSPQALQAMDPEAAVIALGGLYPTPAIKGLDKRNVFGSAEMRQMISGRLQGDTKSKVPAWQRLLFTVGGPFMQRFLTPSLVRSLTRYWMPMGKDIVIVGADLVGCELAEFLAHRGRKVTIVESGKSAAPELPLPMKWLLMDHLAKANVEVLTKVKYGEITDTSVEVETKEGTRRTFKADNVVLAAGIEPNPGFADSLNGKVRGMQTAGDCRAAGLIHGAIADGNKAARAIQ